MDKKQFLKNVKKFLNAVTFRNPCKYCITRPVCDNECKRLEFHANTLLYLILGIGHLILYSITFTIIYLLVGLGIIFSVLITNGICIGTSYFYLVISHGETIKTKTDYISFILFCLSLSLAAYFTDWFDIEDRIGTFVKRINKKLIEVD